MRPERDTEKETEKEEESDHWNHKHIERKIYGPSTPVIFFRFGYEILLFIELGRFRFDLFLFWVFKTQND